MKFVERECPECGKMFMPKSGAHKYCSLYCQRKNNRLVKTDDERLHRCYFCENSIYEDEVKHNSHSFHSQCLEEFLNGTGESVSPIKHRYKKSKRLGGIEVEDSWYGKLITGKRG